MQHHEQPMGQTRSRFPPCKGEDHNRRTEGTNVTKQVQETISPRAKIKKHATGERQKGHFMSTFTKQTAGDENAVRTQTGDTARPRGANQMEMSDWTTGRSSTAHSHLQQSGRARHLAH